MTAPSNNFEYAAESALIDIIKARMGSLAQRIVRGEVSPRLESEAVETLPCLIVSTSDFEEAIYQTGIYQGNINLTVKTDIDRQTASESAALFASLVDVLQLDDLKDLMNNTGKITVQGLVLGPAKTDEVDDRRWIKSISLQVFGFGAG